MSMNERITVVTVTYGDRWKFLSQAIDAVIDDRHLAHCVIVDNASNNKAQIEERQHRHEGKIHVIRSEKNLGSAGGFALGIEYARTLPCDFVLLLDDDNVLEPGGLGMYLDAYNQLSGKRVVSGLRKDIQDEAIFKLPPDAVKLKKTFFDVWSLEKFTAFFRRISGMKKVPDAHGFFPIIPTPGFVYGGALLPIDAIREAPLPDKKLVLYGDDVEYSWGVLDQGYTSYLCHKPVIRDVDMSFEEGDHILGLFNPKSKPFKVYYRIRNMVLISVRNSKQNTYDLLSSIIIWIAGLFFLGILRYGPTRSTFMRMKLILRAVFDGYHPARAVPHEAVLP